MEGDCCSPPHGRNLGTSHNCFLISSSKNKSRVPVYCPSICTFEYHLSPHAQAMTLERGIRNPDRLTLVISWTLWPGYWALWWPRWHESPISELGKLVAPWKREKGKDGKMEDVFICGLILFLYSGWSSFLFHTNMCYVFTPYIPSHIILFKLIYIMTIYFPLILFFRNMNF